MNPNVPMFLDARARARAAGDRGLELAMTADLERIGYRDPADYRTPTVTERVTAPSGMETAAVRAPERTVPAVKPPAAPQGKRGRGGRPPLPRCPHGQVVGRCGKCNTAA